MYRQTAESLSVSTDSGPLARSCSPVVLISCSFALLLIINHVKTLYLSVGLLLFMANRWWFTRLFVAVLLQGCFSVLNVACIRCRMPSLCVYVPCQENPSCGTAMVGSTAIAVPAGGLGEHRQASYVSIDQA